jgi:hypothetical protein
MTSAEVVEARRAGHFDDVVGREKPGSSLPRVTEVDSTDPGAASAYQRRAGSVEQGAQGQHVNGGQLRRSDLQTMTSEQIARARREGRLDELLGATR